MPLFRAVSTSGEIVEYTATAPAVEHFGPGWSVEEIIEVNAVDDAPVTDSTMYGGRRRLTKLEFIALIGDEAFKAILQLAKTSVEVEAWVKKFDIAVPDENGFSINLDDSETQDGLKAISEVLMSMGVVSVDWLSVVLNG